MLASIEEEDLVKNALPALVLAAGMALAGVASAQSDKPHSDRERKEDVSRHRGLAALHEAAAKCLESGKPEKECQEKLRQDCKGLGIGKYCGMRHKH
jgi:hypothetical protein